MTVETDLSDLRRAIFAWADVLGQQPSAVVDWVLDYTEGTSHGWGERPADYRERLRFGLSHARLDDFPIQWMHHTDDDQATHRRVARALYGPDANEVSGEP